MSPAGLFLSAPYSEALFSLLTFAGLAYYRNGLFLAHVEGASQSARDYSILLSGIFLGLATTVRSNGLLNGFLFAYDFLKIVPSLWTLKISVSQFRRLAMLGIGGVLVAVGGLLPQWVAYQEYCQLPPTSSGVERRLWCTNTFPSIYAWVQSSYWNVGFLRYWTISNLPLFLLAAPMLLVMVRSSVWAFSSKAVTSPSSTLSEQSRASISAMCLRRFALPQLLLSILAFTNYHVQIITRLSSGYVVWYWWAALVVGADDKQIKMGKWRLQPGKLMSRWMVMYAIIQAGLFASFLPPA
ncbi:MAG: ER membrane glycoprotein subunit of the GPI transamidase complex-like protein [Candelina submexicana]|nr:MAG: ER membrane glycoprotein subunit of the GPI transamidase complex-like protein [Candelina submexicana]